VFSAGKPSTRTPEATSFSSGPPAVCARRRADRQFISNVCLQLILTNEKYRRFISILLPLTGSHELVDGQYAPSRAYALSLQVSDTARETANRGPFRSNNFLDANRQYFSLVKLAQRARSETAAHKQ
jgi:hypothetical protein